MSWYIKVIKNYVNFNGRARRKEYWMFILFNLIFMAAIVMLELLLGIADEYTGFGAISYLYSFAVMLPAWAVIARRLHDIGKSGWWFFIILVPFIGPFWFLFLLATDSQPGDNIYGPNPKTNPY